MRATSLSLLAFLLAFPAMASATDRVAFDAEVASLSADMTREVPRLVARNDDDDAAWIAAAQGAISEVGYEVTEPQLLVVVDRSPAVQQLRIMAADPAGKWSVVGGTQVSTGKPGRAEHFKTPTGVFVNSSAILGYRAEGTYNENHIRGLGARGMRVWDFGWQPTQDWRHPADTIDIRLSMHSTDPDVLEPRIGHADSEGCVRLRAPMNRFLERHGIIDAQYELAAQTDRRFAALLPKDRRPSGLAGSALVVFDSSAVPSR